jgi:hypothetical protein
MMANLEEFIIERADDLLQIGRLKLSIPLNKVQQAAVRRAIKDWMKCEFCHRQMTVDCTNPHCIGGGGGK